MEEQEPKIKYAIDPETGILVDAQAGPLEKKKYKCYVCKGRLVVEQGEIQTWHFRHYGDEEAKSCSLYYKAGAYEDLLQKLRTSEIEKAEKGQEIRLVLKTNPYVKSLALYGILPTLDHTALPAGTDIDEILNSFHFQHEGLATEPVPSLFRPSEPEVRLELDPDAPKHCLTIQTTLGVPDLPGVWNAQTLQDRDVFAGDATQAELVKNIRSINEGDTVFILHSSKLDKLPGSAALYRLGRWYVVVFELTKETASLFQSLTGENWRNPCPFYAYVVLPSHADPKSHRPIIGEPGSIVSIAVIPPTGMDPEFEVVSIPIDRDGFKPLRKSGPDVPRWFETTFPKEGSTRLSIHWADQHRAVQLHAATDAYPLPTLSTRLLKQKTLGFRIQEGSTSKELLPWEGQPIKLGVHNEARTLGNFGLSLSAPDGLRFGVDAHFSAESDVGPIVHLIDVTMEDLDRKLYGWLKERLERLIIDLGPLGNLEVQFEPVKPWQKDLGEEELLQRLRQLDSLPKKVNWQLVRELCGAPSGTPHDEFPSGIKKRVRELRTKAWKDED